MIDYFTKQPGNIQFYTNNLAYHVAALVGFEFLMLGTISNWGLLSGILLADHRYFSNYS